MDISFDINADINNAINSKGNAVHQVISQNTPLLTAKISQHGTSRFGLDIMDQNFPSTVILSRAYVSQGVYTLTASEPIFGDNFDKFYADNVMYFNTSNALSMITFNWDSPTSIFIYSFDSSMAAKEIDQNDIPFKLYVYPA